MEVSSVSDNSVLDIMAKASKVQSDQTSKLAKMGIEQKMEAEELEIAQNALIDMFG